MISRVRRTAIGLAAAAALLVAAPAAAQAAPPAGVNAMALDGRVELAWQPAAGATGYKVYRGASKTTVTTPLMASPLTPPDLNVPASFTDIGAANGTTYFYAVRAIVGGLESPDSHIVTATPRARFCSGGNVVVQENCFPGDTSWGITVASTGVRAYATAQSINHGESVDLKVQATGASAVDLEIFRNGYYGGAGARLFSTVLDVPVATQPACVNDPNLGLTDCSNWSVTHTLTTTASWPSGVYLIRVVRRDTGDATHILLAVRDDTRRADVLYGLPFSTYQAYNNYGGKSLYPHNSTSTTTVSGQNRAVKVSFDRPYEQQHDSIAHDWYTRTDYATVSWLERSGYDVSYQSATDLERQGTSALDHRLYLSGAHDEYWSAAMRTALEQARDRGVDLFFSGANELYWKVRYEPSPVSGRQDRVLVCYKTTQSGPADPSGIPTTTWRDPAGANRPENGLTGGMYVGQKDFTYFPYKVSAAQGKERTWRYTGLDTQATGTSTIFGTGLTGWEWDARVANGSEPAGVTVLASSPATGDILQDAGRTYAPGSANVETLKYAAASGALVISAGTNHWNWGLALTANGDGEPDRRIQQATTNLMIDMGAYPETPAPNIVLDDPSAPPAVVAKTPAAQATDVDVTSKVVATFSRPMDGATIDASSFRLTRPDGSTVPATVAYDDITFRATLTPASSLALETSYTVALAPSIKAANGIAFTSQSWTFTTRLPDRTSPAVSITAPSDGGTVVSSANVQASAADDVAMAGVQFKLDGADLGAEDTTAPYAYAWDARSVTPGTHRLTAVGRDTSGNTATSATVTVTVDPTGMVGAYGFEETTGSNAVDSSGKANPGTLSGSPARSAAGRIGRAISFDGIDDEVAVPDAPSLDLTNAMTLEAWVNPASASGWRTIMMKEQPGDLVYGLYANTDTNRPSAHVYTTSEIDTRGTAALPVNTWSHVAATYDGATLRIYVNGTLASSKPVTGAMANSTGVLRIGANSIWGERFSGLIDEVRVYRRTLSATEIGTDMTKPVVTPDAVAPSVPGGVSAVGSIGQARVDWTAATDNVGVDHYNVHRSATAGFTPSAANRVAQVAAGTSYTDAGLGAGDYYYRVTAEDAAGNVSGASTEVHATVTADTSAPTVSLTAPADGATVSGTINVTATAADNVTVSGVQFRLDSTDLGAEDTSAPYSTSWSTGAVPNGSHTLTAIARDPAGNRTTATAVTVTVTNTGVDPTGLVGAYGFEETTGTTATDSSGTGNTGTLTNGPVRTTAGKYGSALTFDGINDQVTIPDANSLDLTNAMTLEAWVNPTTTSAWRTVLMKENGSNLAYSLYANSDTNRPSAHIFTSTEFDTRGTAQAAASTWTHLAATYDGATLRIYVNGTLTSSKAITGNVAVSTGALRIGGNGIWGEWFTGKLDEIRVYKRVLSASEIQQDSNLPVKPVVTDSVAPSVPGGVSVLGSIGQAKLDWSASTDNVGVDHYNVHRSATAGFTPSAANRVAQVASGTSYTDAGLGTGDYYYRVTAEDAAGNVSGASSEAHATVTADTGAPSVSLTAPADGATVSGTVNVTASASDNVGVAGVQFRLDGADLNTEDTSAPYSTSWATGSVPNGNHTLAAIARDAANNKTTATSVSVTVTNSGVDPTGLVGAYGFEETTGTTATDSSGTGNTGTLTNGPVRTTAGKYGSALTFDGINDQVTIPDANSLDLSTALTLEAWVKPTTLTNFRTVLLKENGGNLAYSLYVNSDTNRPSAHVFTTAEFDTRGTAVLPVNAWSHLATTYDGATLRLYLNGTQVSSKAVTGAVANSTGALRIGGNNIWPEWYSGVIDEVRVYKRVLSATEVAQDSARAVVGG